MTEPVTVGLALLRFAVFIGPDGVLRSKSLVNGREHLESLMKSMDCGFESIQDYLFRPEGLEEGLEQKAS